MNEPLEEEAVSIWLEDLKITDNSAAEELWDHFFTQLHSIADKS